MEDLKKCPFCGGNNIEIRYLDEDYGEVVCDSEEELDQKLSPWIICVDCSTEIFPRELDTPREVIEKWNERN